MERTEVTPVTAAIFALALNLTVVTIFGGWDVHFGALHVGAHSIFKALLELEGGFLLAMLWHRLQPVKKAEVQHTQATACAPLVVALVLAIYLPSLAINLSYHDWTHRHLSVLIHSFGDVARQFTTPKADGFYRPMTFVSLWADFRIFGERWWGYHLQSILLHVANALLVAALARRLRFSESATRWAALLFAAAAVNFEPVLWPAARFDLLAAFFTLLALIASLDYLAAPTPSWFQSVKPALFFTLALTNKESAYCFPLVLTCVILMQRPPQRRTLALMGTVLAVTAGMILVRIAVYHSLGGYPPAPGEAASPHFQFGWKTVTSLVIRIPLPLLGVNTSLPLPAWFRGVLVVFGALLVWLAFAGARVPGNHLTLVACALSSAVPTLNIIDWIGDSMQHSRYLYMPAIWIVLLVSSALENLPQRKFLLSLLILINALGAFWNLNVYRLTLHAIDTASRQVRQDQMSHPAAGKILLVDLPHEPYGVFFFDWELVEKIKAALPQKTVEVVSEYSSCADRAYRWEAARAALVQEPPPAGCASP